MPTLATVRGEGPNQSVSKPGGEWIENFCTQTQNFCMAATPLQLDDFDHRLLELLQRDADATLTALGDAVGLSASAVQRRIARYRKHHLLRQVAVLDPALLGNVTLVAALVMMERESAKQHAAFYARMRAAPEVQQCYALAGDWDYLVILATTSVAHYREVAEKLFLDEGYVRRYDTRLIFETVKLGMQVPTRAPTKRRK